VSVAGSFEDGQGAPHPHPTRGESSRWRYRLPWDIFWQKTTRR